MALSGSLNFLNSSVTGSPNINVDFVGLNTLIVDPITASLNLLGHPVSDTATPIDSEVYYNSLIDPIGGPEPNQLNSLLLNRNGPYQHPMWKQWRGGDHPVARHLRLNNTMSIDLNDPNAKIRQLKKDILIEHQRAIFDNPMDNVDDYFSWINQILGGVSGFTGEIANEIKAIWPGRPPTLKHYYEPVLTTKHKPFLYTVEFPAGPGSAGTVLAKVRLSLMNQMMDFSNEKLNEALRFSSGDPTTGSVIESTFTEYAKINKTFTRTNQKTYQLFYNALNTNNPSDFLYSERIYPKEINSYRTYKLQRQSYEEIPGLGDKGYDKALRNTFWKDSQGGNTQAATSDGTTRLRTDGTALSSLEIEQHTIFNSSLTPVNCTARQLVSSSYILNPSWGQTLVTTSLHYGINGLIVEYAPNGVVINRYQDITPSGAIFQLDSYQPYPISLLSSWPLDARDDVYDKPSYLTSSMGGKGLQIGLTPHKAGVHTVVDTDGNNISTSLYNQVQSRGGSPISTGSVLGATLALHTASAGELVYSTKPTIFFWRNITDKSNNYSRLYLSASSYAHPKPGILGDGKFELADPQGNRVAFHFGRDDSWRSDGRTATISGTTFVTIGLGASGQPEADPDTIALSLRNFVNAINGVSSYNNGLTLNINASRENYTIKLIPHTYNVGQSIRIPKYDAHFSTWFTASTEVVAFGTDPSTGMSIPAGDHFQGQNSGSISRSGQIMSLLDDSVQGYNRPTASLQYNRHTFPYNTPFYATNRVRGRNPFYDSYNDFSDSVRLIGRDYSILPEYRYSDHMDYYHENYDVGETSRALYTFWPIGTALDGSAGPGAFKRNPLGITPVAGGVPGQKNMGEHTEPGGMEKFKANFLVLDGAFITSSATANVYDELAARYEYDDVEGSVATTPLLDGLGAELPRRSYKSDRTSIDFDGKYVNTDSMINFSNLLDQGNQGFFNDIDTIPDEINFVSHVVKKFLPRNGVFPVTRTIQIGNAFKKEIITHAGLTGTMSYYPEGQVGSVTGELNNLTPSYVQTILEPFMAPGILYNSIKSGVAVNYPIYFTAPSYYFPGEFTTSTGATKNMYGLARPALSSSYHGGLYMMGSSRCIPSILTSQHDRTLPFKALYDYTVGINLFTLPYEDTGKPPSLHLVSDFIDMDRAWAGSAGNPRQGHLNYNASPRIQIPDKGKWKIFGKKTYYSMMNNYLSETIDFFLQESQETKTKLPVALSGLFKDNIKLGSSDHLMQVSLEMGKHQVMAEGPRNAGIGRSSGFDTSRSYFLKNSTMRGYIYGPPMEIIAHSASVHDEDGLVARAINWGDPGTIGSDPKGAVLHSASFASYFGANLQDPAYHAYTPPYFYGKSSVVYKTSLSNDTSLTDIYDDIKSQNQTYYVDKYEKPIFTDETNDLHKLHSHSLSLIIPSTASISDGARARMKLDASVEVFSDLIEISTPSTPTDAAYLSHIWHITPEWVCPVLDFSSSVSNIQTRTAEFLGAGVAPSYQYNNTTINNTFHDTTTGRGLWGGYGTNPYIKEEVLNTLNSRELEYSSEYTFHKGLYMEISDYILQAPEKDKQPDSVVSLDTSDEESYYGVVPIASAVHTSSLADKLGFTKTRYEIGRIASEKQVHEAIALIPYFDDPIHLPIKSGITWDGGRHDKNFIYATREILPGKHFLPIHERVFESMLSIYIMNSIMSENDILTANMFGAGSADAINNGYGMPEGVRSFLLNKTDVGQMIQRLSAFRPNHGGYVLPPEFDFIHNSSILPFQIILIEHDHLLDRQELTDIYQGIMPDSSLSAEKLIKSSFVQPGLELDLSGVHMSAVVPGGPNWPLGLHAGQALASSHPLNFLSPAGILRSNEQILDVVNEEKAIWTHKTSRQFYKNLRFMVFKVKQRAKKDYSSYRTSQILKAVRQTKLAEEQIISDPKESIQMNMTNKYVGEVFGANWPYDHFSLIESAKIDIEFKKRNK